MKNTKSRKYLNPNNIEISPTFSTYQTENNRNENHSHEKAYRRSKTKRKRHRDDKANNRERRIAQTDSTREIPFMFTGCLQSLCLLNYQHIHTHTHIPIHLFCTPPLFIYFIKYQHTHNLKAQATDSVVCFNIPCCCRFFFAFFALFLSLCLSRCLLQTESSAHLFIINPVFFGSSLCFRLAWLLGEFLFFFG